MVEEKKGHVKITIEVEVNEPLMEIIKESVANIPAMMQMVAKQRRKEQR